MFVTSAMRRMSRKVVSRTATSLLGARNSAMNVRHSLMWNATTTRIAASVASGIRPAQRPKKSVINSRVIACTIPAIGVRPPFFTFVAVRAIAPVAGIPPNNGEAMLAMPCATSSMLERWRPPIMPSATTADSSDSIAARSAIVKAGRGQAGVDLAEPSADRLDRQVQQLGQRGGHDQRDKRPRNAGGDLGPHQNDRERGDGDHERPRIDRIEGVNIGVPLRQERRWDGRHLETEQVTDLTREDDQRDAAGEADRHRIGSELDRTAEAQQAEGDEDEAGHERGHDQPIDAVLEHY